MHAAFSPAGPALMGCPQFDFPSTDCRRGRLNRRRVPEHGGMAASKRHHLTVVPLTPAANRADVRVALAAVRPSTGSVTIPAKLRRRFGLDKPGAQVEIVVRGDEIVLIPRPAAPAEWSRSGSGQVGGGG